ncbi:MAG: HEPN domain-containing protein [archaeon]
MTEVDDCFEKGLLKKITPSKNLAFQDIKQAEFFLDEAFDLIKIKKREMTAIALYNSVFHAARALLYRDGVKEKSHYCLQKYLEEKYEKQKLLDAENVSLFDVLRGIRQEVQYNVTRVKFEEDLDELYDRTEQFIEKVKKILSK